MALKNLFKATLLLCCLFSASVLFAQGKSPEERAKAQTDWMQQNLGISADQAKSAYTVNLSHAQEVDKERSAGNDKQKMQTIHAKRDKGLQAILSPAQFSKYKQHEMEEWKKNSGK